MHRLELARRFIDRVPSVHAAAAYRQIETRYETDIFLDREVDMPSFDAYRVLYLIPRINTQEVQMQTLKEDFGLRIGDAAGEGVVGSNVRYDPRVHRLHENASESSLQKGEWAHIAASAIYTKEPNGSFFQVFEPAVVPLPEEDSVFFD